MQTTLFQPRVTRLSIFSHREVAEISRLLLPGEQVLGMLSGFYTTGTATLCATTARLLLVDKKLLRMRYEDIRYQAISEVSYAHQGLLASVHFFYAGSELLFRSLYRRELQTLAQFVQIKMSEERGGMQAVYKQPSRQMIDTHVPDPLEQIRRWRKASEFMQSLQLVQRV